MTLVSSLSVLISLFIQSVTLSVLAFDSPHQNESTINATPILQDVLKEISAKQKWDLEEVKFTKLEVKKVRVGTGRSSEIRIRLGKIRFVFVFPEVVTDWTRRRRRSQVEFVEVVREINSTKALDPILLKGPLELRVAGDDDRLSLGLPMNILHSGLKRVLVSEGISIEIREAQAVSLFHSSNRRFTATVHPVDIKESSCFLSSLGSACVPLPPIEITGSASIIAFKTTNADSQIKTSYLPDETIQLLPEKCYYNTYMYKQRNLPTDLIGLKIDKLEKVLTSLGNNGNRETVTSVTAKLKASSMVRFQLEIERRIGRNESTTSKKGVEWRRKPKIERVWYEITAKVEGEKLKATGMKKVVPFIEVDTEAWSSFMSNMSFTKFPSILVPQEALTLDIKW